MKITHGSARIIACIPAFSFCCFLCVCVLYATNVPPPMLRRARKPKTADFAVRMCSILWCNDLSCLIKCKYICVCMCVVCIVCAQRAPIYLYINGRTCECRHRMRRTIITCLFCLRFARRRRRRRRRHGDARLQTPKQQQTHRGAATFARTVRYDDCMDSVTCRACAAHACEIVSVERKTRANPQIEQGHGCVILHTRRECRELSIAGFGYYLLVVDGMFTFSAQIKDNSPART